MYANHGHLCIALEASSHQIVWFGVQIFAYPLEAILELFNDLWHAHNHWCIWPGYLLAVWGHEGDLMGTKPCGSISGGWSLFQQFLGCKLVMGLSTEGIPINIFEIVPYIPHKSGVTQYIGWIGSCQFIGISQQKNIARQHYIGIGQQMKFFGWWVHYGFFWGWWGHYKILGVVENTISFGWLVSALWVLG